jgi:riboflavin synthase
VARWQNRVAEIAVIPFTYAHTNLADRKPGDAVNLEGDILGKYVERYLESRKESKEAKGSSLTLEALVAQGF